MWSFSIKRTKRCLKIIYVECSVLQYYNPSVYRLLLCLTSCLFGCRFSCGYLSGCLCCRFGGSRSCLICHMCCCDWKLCGCGWWNFYEWGRGSGRWWIRIWWSCRNFNAWCWLGRKLRPCSFGRKAWNSFTGRKWWHRSASYARTWTDREQYINKTRIIIVLFKLAHYLSIWHILETHSHKISPLRAQSAF